MHPQFYYQSVQSLTYLINMLGIVSAAGRKGGIVYYGWPTDQCRLYALNIKEKKRDK
jgi:hypothetical protein